MNATTVKLKDRRKLQAMLLESLKGKSFVATKEWWDQFFTSLKSRKGKRPSR